MMPAPVDLDRARAARDLIRATVAEHPEIRERTARFLASNPDADTLEAPLSDRRDTPVRIPTVLLDRADALIDPLEERLDLLAYSRPSRASIVRLALGLGLDALEAEIAKGGTHGQE